MFCGALASRPVLPRRLHVRTCPRLLTRAAVDRGRRPPGPARFFVDAQASLGADRMALAHTRDDQAETVVLRLARGAGPQRVGRDGAAARGSPGPSGARISRAELRGYPRVRSAKRGARRRSNRAIVQFHATNSATSSCRPLRELNPRDRRRRWRERPRFFAQTPVWSARSPSSGPAGRRDVLVSSRFAIGGRWTGWPALPDALARRVTLARAGNRQPRAHSYGLEEADPSRQRAEPRGRGIDGEHPRRRRGTFGRRCCLSKEGRFRLRAQRYGGQGRSGRWFRSQAHGSRNS